MSNKKQVVIPLITEEKSFEITSATIKDGKCNYVFEIKKGVGIGDSHKVTGSSFVHPDLEDAMGKFRVHLACVDDVFKHNSVEFENIDELENNELAAAYSVTGVKIKGEDESLSVTIGGHKHVTVGGIMDLESPKIILDGTGGYKWFDELRACVDAVRSEVEQYKAGKCVLGDDEDVKDGKQLTITSANFEDGKVD